MATIKIGGSSNVILDLAVSTGWELTGLDANGKVLQSLNVKVKPDGVATTFNLTLPTIASLNNRTCTYNIDTNDYGKAIVVIAGSGNFVNGEATLTIAYPKESVTPITSTSSDNWTLPVIQEAP